MAPTTVPVVRCQFMFLSGGSEDFRTQYLYHKRHTRCKLDVLTEFQVLKQSDTLNHRVLTVESTVHVGDGTARNDVSGDHLEETGSGGVELVETDGGSQHSIERAEYEGDDYEHGESPPWHTGVASVVR